MFRRIVVPLDGSQLAERALAPAIALARQDGAEVILLRVPVLAQMFIAAEGGYGLLYPEKTLNESREAAVDYLQAVRQANAAENYSLRSMVGEGDVAGALVDKAAEEKADLIVMSSHGYSGLTRWVLGSVAEKVLRAAPCPVLVVRSPQAARNVLVTLDGSPLAEQAVAPAVELAQGLDAQLTLLRVVPQVGADSLTKLDTFERGLGHRFVQETHDEAASYLDGVAESYHRPGLAIKTVVREGLAANTILKYAELHDVDIITMATHGRTGLRRWMYEIGRAHV